MGRGGGRPHGTLCQCVLAVYRGHTAHLGPAEVTQATNCDRLGSEDGSRARGATSLAVCAVHSAQAMSSPGVCRRPDRLSHIESRCAGHARSATRAHQLPRLSGGSARQRLQCASTGGSVPACANLSECRPAAPGAVGFVLKASLASEVRSLWSRDHVREGPGRWTAMDARHWSGLMCLETQGTRGGGPALVLDGIAERLTHNQLGSTYVSEVTRWACRWRRSASRCIPDGRSGRNVGVWHWASQ